MLDDEVVWMLSKKKVVMKVGMMFEVWSRKKDVGTRVVMRR